MPNKIKLNQEKMLVFPDCSYPYFTRLTSFLQIFLQFILSQKPFAAILNRL